MVHFVVPLMESDAVVIDLRMEFNEPIEMVELLASIELVFIGLYDSTGSNNIHGLNTPFFI